MTRKPVPPPPPPPVPKCRPGVPFAIGHSVNSLVPNPEDLLDYFDEFERKCQADEQPVTLGAFLGAASRVFGIHRRWWNMHSRGDKDASKIPGLRDVVLAIETRVAGHLEADGISGRAHPSMAARALDVLEKRDAAVAQKEADAQVLEQQADTLPNSNEKVDDHLAIHVHPDDPDPLNLPRPLYSRAQIEAGLPFFPPTHD